MLSTRKVATMFRITRELKKLMSQMKSRRIREVSFGCINIWKKDTTIHIQLKKKLKIFALRPS
jgi:hypothetical protein